MLLIVPKLDLGRQLIIKLYLMYWININHILKHNLINNPVPKYNLGTIRTIRGNRLIRECLLRNAVDLHRAE